MRLGRGVGGGGRQRREHPRCTVLGRDGLRGSWGDHRLGMDAVAHAQAEACASVISVSRCVRHGQRRTCRHRGDGGCDVILRHRGIRPHGLHGRCADEDAEHRGDDATEHTPAEHGHPRAVCAAG